MPKGVHIALRIATSCVILAGFLALSTTQEFGLSLALIPLILFAIMPICEQLDVEFKAYRVFTSFLNFMFVPIVFVAPFYLGLLNAVIMLVIYIQVYLMLHRKRERDYYYLYLMAFFLLVASCVLSPEATIGFVMFFFLVSAIWAFLILQIYVESGHNQSVLSPDIIGLHERDEQVIAPPESWLDAGIVLPVTGLCIVSILLTVALFLFTPRMEAGFFSRRESSQITTGLSDEVTIPTSGQIVPDPRLVLRAEFPDESGGRYNGEFFWRTAAYDTYNGQRWSRRHIAARFNDSLPSPAYRSPVEDGSSRKVLLRTPSDERRSVHQVIYLDRVPEEGVPCLSTVTRFEAVVPSKTTRIMWDEYNSATIQVESAGLTNLNYEAWSDVEDNVDPAILRNASDNYESVIEARDLRQLTRQGLSPAAQTLAREVTGGQTNVYDKVRAIEAWFQSDRFAYSLTIPALDRERPIDDFILNVQVGHCQLYATAMALMLRSLDIPCRVVSGYRGAEWVDAENAYVVRADMAHLWVEVYFIGHGWFSFDPSPPLDRELTGLSGLRREMSLLALRAKMFWFSEVVGFQGFQFSRLRSFSLNLFGFGNDDEPPSSGTGSDSGGGGSFPWLPALVLGAGAIFVLGRRRRTVQERVRLSLDQLRAQRLFFLIRRQLRRAGRFDDGKSAEELSEDAATQSWSEPERLIEALDVYNECRFGGRPLAPDHLARLKQSLRTLRRQTQS